MIEAWPVTLTHGDIRLRPIKLSDAKPWQQLRQANQEWMQEWEATAPLPIADPAPTFRQLIRILLREAKQGRSMPFIVEYRGEFCGQLNVSGITQGSARGCHFGYWIDQDYSGLGIMTTAAALVTEHLFNAAQLHRVEIAIRPENEPSNRLVQRLGFRFEGLRPSFLHINHAWRDHNIYAMTAEEHTESLLNRLKT